MTPSPICAPARACLATGMDYHGCGVPSNNENTPLDKRTYYQALREIGYQVAGVGKFDLHKADLDWGVDGKNLLDEYGFTDGIDNEGKGDAIWAYRNQGKPHGPYLKFLEERGCLKEHLKMYEAGSDDLLFEAISELPEDAYCDNWIAQNGLDQLLSFSKEQPWHLVVNFAGPHDPYDVTASMRARWQDINFPENETNDVDEPAAILLRQQNYAAMIENIDAQIGRYLVLLEERGETDNTIIIYSSDHGEMLGDHNRWQKSVWNEGAVRIPMIVSGPGVLPQVSGALVSFHDLGATMLDFAESEGLPGADAKSFREVLEGHSKRHRDYLNSALADWRMVYDGRFKLVIHENQDPLLFDLREDPNELENLAEKYPCKVQQLGARVSGF